METEQELAGTRSQIDNSVGEVMAAVRQVLVARLFSGDESLHNVG